MKFFIIYASLFIFFICRLSAQDTDHFQKSDVIRVYLDGIADADYMHEQIAFVTFVRDRFEADVHILETTALTAGNGTDYSLQFIGRNTFEGQMDTLHYFAKAESTTDETRSGIAQVIKIGLIPFVSHTSYASQINIQYTGSAANDSVKEPDDKWHKWVISLNTYANANFLHYNTAYYVSGNIAATKITDDWKIGFSANYFYSYSAYDYDGFKSNYKNTSQDFRSTIVKSLDKHWSAGGSAEYSGSTYSNYDLHLFLMPAVEYDVFPYSDNTTKLFTFLYQIGPVYTIYTDTTIYNKKQELLYSNSLQVSLNLVQKWGSINTGASASAYLHDFTKNYVSVSCGLNVNLFKGFSLNASTYFSIIHDQLNLPKEGASEEEVLLQLQEIKTNYQLYTYFGITYTFGSIYNNIVNPRFSSVFY